MTVELFHLCHWCRHWSELHRWCRTDTAQLGFSFWNTGNGMQCIQYQIHVLWSLMSLFYGVQRDLQSSIIWWDCDNFGLDWVHMLVFFIISVAVLCCYAYCYLFCDIISSCLSTAQHYTHCGLWLWLQSWLMPQSPHRLGSDLKCVEWDVKPSPTQPNPSCLSLNYIRQCHVGETFEEVNILERLKLPNIAEYTKQWYLDLYISF